MNHHPEMTRADLAAHAVKIAAADSEARFVAAFAGYVRDVVECETDPYEKIALFVHAMVEGQREVIAELTRYRGGGAA